MRISATAQRRVVQCMGTVFSFDVRSPGVDASAIDEAIEWLHEMDATFSTYRADSDISLLGAGRTTRGACRPEVGSILDEGERLHAVTGGYFTIFPDGRLDPSGLVKGWAIERVSDLLVEAGSLHHCINGGGDVQCVGSAGTERPWRVGIAHPVRTGELAAIVVGSDIAVATSGLAERGTHIVNPHTGRAAHELASLTVTGPGLALVDAYATAAFAMGGAAREFVESLPDHEAFAVLPDQSTWHTSGWRHAA